MDFVNDVPYLSAGIQRGEFKNESGEIIKFEKLIVMIHENGKVVHELGFKLTSDQRFALRAIPSLVR